MSGFAIYTAGWGTACAVALGLLATRPGWFRITGRAYWRMLLTPWKLGFFAVALVGITVMAPYTGDPTWDRVDAPLMAALTFVTAPWAVGVFARASLRDELRWLELFAAACAWGLSASWCYDAYLWWRDGFYPVTWLANLFASSILYAFAGLFWNLEWTASRGVHLGFTEDAWPRPSDPGAFRRLAPMAALVMLPVAVFFLAFLF